MAGRVLGAWHGTHTAKHGGSGSVEGSEVPTHSSARENVDRCVERWTCLLLTWAYLGHPLTLYLSHREDQERHPVCVPAWGGACGPHAKYTA